MDMSRIKRGYLIINKRKHPVFEGLNPIGRDKQSTVMILDHTISHQQAVVVIIKEKHYICDMNSCNGTQLEHDKLVPLQLYEVDDKKKIYFGNVKAVYETMSQDSNTQEFSQISQVNDSVFDAPTQMISLPDMTSSTGNTIDSRAIGDHSHFESCVTIQGEPCASEIIDTSINRNNITGIEAALQAEANRSNTKDRDEEEAVKDGEVSSLCIHDLPTQLIDGSLNMPLYSNETENAVSKLLKLDKPEMITKRDIENDKKKEFNKEEISIHDMPTQIDFDSDDPEIKNDSFSQSSDDVQQVMKDLQDLPNKTWDEDFFNEKAPSIHDEQTQLITPTAAESTIAIKEPDHTMKINSLPTQIPTLSEKNIADNENKNIHSLPTQLIVPIESEQNVASQENKALDIENEKKQSETKEATDSEEEMSQHKDPNESNVIEETIINKTVQNNEEQDVNVDEDSDCSADFLATEAATQFFGDYPLEPKSCDDNFSSSLRTSTLKRKVKNVITFDDESKEKGGESSDETDAEIQQFSEGSTQSSLRTNLLKNRVKNLIASDEEDRQESKKKKGEDSSDETDAEIPIKLTSKQVSTTSSSTSNENEIIAVRRKKLTKKSSPLKDNQKPDSDSEDENIEKIIKRKRSPRTCQKAIEKNLEDDSSDTDIEKREHDLDANSNSVLNNSDFIPATQDCLPKTIPRIQKKLESNKISTASVISNSEESLDFSLNLMLTESMAFEDDQPSKSNEKAAISVKDNSKENDMNNIKKNISENLDNNTEHSMKENKEEREGEGHTEEIKIPSNSMIRNITILENDEDDIFMVATQPITSSEGNSKLKQTSINLNTQVKDVEDDIFLKATQEICERGDTEKNNLKQRSFSINQTDEDINDREDDIFEQPTQILDRGCASTKSTEIDDIFMQETQPIVPTTTDLFVRPVKPLITKNKKLQCQVDLVKKHADPTSKQVPVSSSVTSDDDIFMQATQPILVNKDHSNTPTESTTIKKDENDDIFMQATQVIASNDKNQKATITSIDDENDVFLQATQPVILSKGSIKEVYETDDTEGKNDIFLQPTQDLSKTNPDFQKPKLEICKFPVIQVRGDIFNSPPETTNSIEATMQKLFQSQQTQDDVYHKPTQKLAPSIESQLEVLFASQSQSCVKNEFRPQNPLANILEKLQAQNEIILPPAEEEKGNEKGKANLTLGKNENNKSEDQSKVKVQNKNKDRESTKEQDKNKDQGKDQDLDKSKGQDKINDQCKIKDLNKIKEQGKSIEGDEVMEIEQSKGHGKNKDQEKMHHGKEEKDMSKNGDHKVKSKSRKKTEKTKHEGSKKKAEESVDTKGSNEKKEKKHEKKSKSEEELVKILQMSKVEKERTRRQVQKICHDVESLKETQEEKVSCRPKTRSSCQDAMEFQKETKNINFAESPSNSRSPIDYISKKANDSVKAKASAPKEINEVKMIPLVKMVQLENINTKKDCGSLSSMESGTASKDDKNSKNRAVKKTRASSSSSVERRCSETFEGLSRMRTRGHSSSPLNCVSPRLEIIANQSRQLESHSNETESKCNLTTAQLCGKEPLPRQNDDSKNEENKQKEGSSTEKEDEETKMTRGKSKNPTKRSHRTQKSSKSSSPQIPEQSVGDSTTKSSENTIKDLEEPNSPLGDNIESFVLLRKSKRKSNITYKSKQKRYRKEPELSLIEELPEVSEKIDSSRILDETVNHGKSGINENLKKKVQVKNPTKETTETPIKTSNSTSGITHISNVSTCSKMENDNLQVITKRTRQKQRRHSNTSEDDFIVKTTSKRSRLDISTPGVSQSSNISDTTFSGSIFSNSPERSKRKIKPKVVFTMMDSPEMESLIRRLGGSVVDGVDSCTVLVTPNVKRSQKLLEAVGQGKPICSTNWLEECKKANKFLDPWNYILKDVEAEKKWNFSLEESLNRSKNKKLLENYVILLLVNTAVDVLKGAIEACGGKPALRCPVKYQDLENFVIVANPENKSKYSKFLKHDPKPTIVAAEAVFDTVLRQEINFQSHLLA